MLNAHPRTALTNRRPTFSAALGGSEEVAARGTFASCAISSQKTSCISRCNDNIGHGSITLMSSRWATMSNKRESLECDGLERRTESPSDARKKVVHQDVMVEFSLVAQTYLCYCPSMACSSDHNLCF